MPDDPSYPVLHVYAQSHPHAEAFLVGTRAGLERLRATLQLALDHATPGTFGIARVFGADGEGYELHVRLETEDGMLAYVAPYTAPEYAWDHESPAWPKKP